MKDADAEEGACEANPPSGGRDAKRDPMMRGDTLRTSRDAPRGGERRPAQFVFDTVLEGMRTSIYVTDPETDEILYMNGFMKHDYGIENPGRCAGGCCRRA
ncbi:MAG: hypothetical protein ACLSVD_11260 [Eggerthellaceae bacterium]